MRKNVIFLLARQLCKDAFRSKVMLIASLLILFLLLFSAYTGWENYHDQNLTRGLVQDDVQESWESNPDKHPHRMAHYGSFALRKKHVLSGFDLGMENFVGNAVFLEAHKQNTVNFSEASMSTGLLRFGEVSLAMLLKVIIPLLIFYLGFATIAKERENGTLKLLIGQGITRKEIVFGKWLGLWSLSLIFLFTVFLVVLFFVLIGSHDHLHSDTLIRYFVLLLSYLLFFGILSAITILISAFSKTAKGALVKLLGIWLLFVIIMPKSLQAIGYYFYPTPSKIEMETAVEHDLTKLGDSHNPDDPHFKALKDSVLLAHNVQKVDDLPFNYGGFIMAQGEKLSTAVYLDHQERLYEVYTQQNNVERYSAFINPYTAIKNLSMAFSGTDFKSYLHFKSKAEAYRFKLAQDMNQLQMDFIPNKGKEGPSKISNKYWKEFPPFEYKFLAITKVFKNEVISILALCLWGFLVIFGLSRLSTNLKAI
jgi:ABC-2 type transport system permease protein|tara:strand:+ start:4372 stop:5811 length:1440 start_codon:yes stop_codon:yes gene_type:complete